MTVTLEKWQSKDNNKIIATIRQDKYCFSYNVVIGELMDDFRIQTTFNGIYHTMKSARQAIKRQGNFEKVEV